MTEKDKRQGGRPFKSGGGKPSGRKPFGKPRGPAKGRPERETRPPKAYEGERIAKAMARAGACSRRDAEEWIAEGRVAVNGRTLESPAFNVTSVDKITIDGRPMAARDKTRLFLFHKPRGYVTTDHDPEGRETIFDYLSQRHPDLPRLMTVGRLDINTEGLLLMTNDGGLARTLELPQTGWLRRYRVRAHGETDQAALDTLAKGVNVDGVDYAPIEAKHDRVQGANTWLTLGLREGKNREVRRVLGSIGLDVNRLIRVSYGPFQLGELAEGAVEEVKTRVLRDQLGPSLIAQSQADFDAPAREDDERGAPKRERGERGPNSREYSERGQKNRERDFSRDREERAPRARGGDRPDRERPSRAFEGRPGREKFERRDERAELEPKRERPKSGPRKHVSTLRADRDKRMHEDDRVKIERSETADRKGRAVKVERVVSTAPKPVEDTRNARRFKAERGGDRPMRRGRDDRAGERPPRGEGRAERSFGPGRSSRDGGDRPQRFGGSRDEGARPPREGQRDGAKRFARDDRGGDRPFKRADKPGGERKGPRPGGSRPGGSRPGGDRPRSGGPRKPRGK
ncbi:MAG: pseudouridine synthase [Hyphomicrobiales bacterium]|nr:pseudouridine synthase [Hyphomicrobiales bacterium]